MLLHPIIVINTKMSFSKRFQSVFKWQNDFIHLLFYQFKYSTPGGAHSSVSSNTHQEIHSSVSSNTHQVVHTPSVQILTRCTLLGQFKCLPGGTHFSVSSNTHQVHTSPSIQNTHQVHISRSIQILTRWHNSNTHQEVNTPLSVQILTRWCTLHQFKYSPGAHFSVNSNLTRRYTLLCQFKYSPGAHFSVNSNTHQVAPALSIQILTGR